MNALTIGFLVLGGIFTLIGAVLVEKNRASEAETLASKSDEITRLTRANAQLVVGVSTNQTKYANMLKERSDQSAAKSDEITRLTKANAELAVNAAREQVKASNILKAQSDQLASKSNEIAAKSDEIAAKSEEIAHLTKTNANQVTGGDSYCFLRVIPTKEGNNAYLDVAHHGAFPVYDVVALIADLSDEHMTQKQGDAKTMTGTTTTWKIGTVINGWLPTSTGPIPLVDKGSFLLRVFIQARNGTFIEDIVGRRLENTGWHFDLRVSKLDPLTKKYIIVRDEKDHGQPPNHNVLPTYTTPSA